MGAAGCVRAIWILLNIWIDLDYSLGRFFTPELTGNSPAGSDNYDSGQEVRVFAPCLFDPNDRILISIGNEMGERCGTLL